MRCTVELCQSGNTRRIKRTLKLYYNTQGEIIDAHLEELWLCNNCGTAFMPATSKIEPWHLPFTKRKRISKSAIIKELFRA